MFLNIRSPFLRLKSQFFSRKPEPYLKDRNIPLEGSYEYDLKFLRRHKRVVELSDSEGLSKIIVCPELQGRVMTSTTRGNDGYGFGWINYDLIASGSLNKKINSFGGEDRFWIGPEGGQYSIFFEPCTAIDFNHWRVPSVIDTESFEIVKCSGNSVFMKKKFQVINFQNVSFIGNIDRSIHLLDKGNINNAIGIEIPDSVTSVGFESRNKLTNKGLTRWTKDNGLLCIWILGTQNASDFSTVIIPYKQIPDTEPANLITSYYNPLDAKRLRILKNAIFFKGDGEYWSKIGLSHIHCVPVMGSYDSKRQCLTIIQFSFDKTKSDYMKMTWELQKDPYNGDIINSYNDGLSSQGDRLGNFYELESCSPAYELENGESFSHMHRTMHFEGKKEDLNRISEYILGVNLLNITDVFS
jgi:hypothetical protein